MIKTVNEKDERTNNMNKLLNALFNEVHDLDSKQNDIDGLLESINKQTNRLEEEAEGIKNETQQL